MASSGLYDDDIKPFASFEADPEANFFLKHFKEEKGKVLEVGANDCPLANVLYKEGFDVFAIDLRPYKFPHKHPHIVGDFLNLDASFWKKHRGTFDYTFSVSAIEHFGLGTYNEPIANPYADVMAVRYMYDLLKKGGKCYLTVPFGGRFVVNGIHWRVYDWASVIDRLVQDFVLEQYHIQVSENFGQWKANEPVQEWVPNRLVKGEPYCSILLILRKR